MNTPKWIFNNVKANIRNDALYLFALAMSVALYFSFVTLQYDPAVNALDGTVRGGAAIMAGSYLLVAIVTIFLLYANSLFIKRRSKEIGLLQLVGMQKSRIVRLISAESLLILAISFVTGIFTGFAFSKLTVLGLLKITGIDEVAQLSFSTRALVQTIIVFSVIYIIIVLRNARFIYKQRILTLFHNATTVEKSKQNSVRNSIAGVLGLLFVGGGYFLSSRLFNTEFTGTLMFGAQMILILLLVIVGTYLFYRGSVSLVTNLLRKRMDGYLSIRSVLSLSSIMFKMKSNAMLLTIITTVSALAIGLLSLTYIGYYSTEKQGERLNPMDYTFYEEADYEAFQQRLTDEGISFTAEQRAVQSVELLLDDLFIQPEIGQFGGYSPTPVISDRYFPEYDVQKGEILLTGSSDLMETLLPMKEEGTVQWLAGSADRSLTYIGLEKNASLSTRFTFGGYSAVVDDETFREMEAYTVENDIPNAYFGIDLASESDFTQANDLFRQMELMPVAESKSIDIEQQKQALGLIVFIVGFLGVAFLVSSGCILYFKQMDDSDEERRMYETLRKLGFTESDLMKGIRVRQLLNFGIPLALGLVHSYFAVQSGWFIFGTELWIPMAVVMGLYTALYSLFGFLSVLHFKKTIREAL